MLSIPASSRLIHDRTSAKMAFLPTPVFPSARRHLPSTTRPIRARGGRGPASMTAARVQPLNAPTPLDKAVLPTTPIEAPEDAQARFRTFFGAMPGSWNSQPTYHYLTRSPPREDSRTTFDVAVLTSDQVHSVLRSNGTMLPAGQLVDTQGLRVEFLTKMASQDELVRAGTNLAFVPEVVYEGGVIAGAYYRDLGYEEAAPIKARFVFDCGKMELTMTTFYSRVVSVDQISLISEQLRLRKIVNYRRVPEGQVMDDAVLVGFGVERKGESERLVS